MNYLDTSPWFHRSVIDAGSNAIVLGGKLLQFGRVMSCEFYVLEMPLDFVFSFSDWGQFIIMSVHRGWFWRGLRPCRGFRIVAKRKLV